jgi:hypothetical protein
MWVRDRAQVALLRQHAGVDRSLLVVADGAAWIRTFYRDYLARLPQAEMLLDWHHLVRQEAV